MQQSILQSVKAQIPISPDQGDVFDTQIIIYINSTFANLHQLGLGPKNGFRINDEHSTWEEFIGSDDPRFNDVITYVGLKVKLLFDPPANATLLGAIKDAIKEAEWRLNISAESYEPLPEEDLF